MNEIWKDVVGYEGIYQVSNFGQIKRIKSGRNTKPGTILKHTLDRSGYHHVTLYKGAKATRKNPTVHKIVANAFLGPCPDGFNCNHKDGDKDNNCADNFEYLDCKAHMAHTRHVLGKAPDTAGTKNGNATLNEEMVLRIRQMYATGQFYLRELASEYCVTRQTISCIVHGKTWTHVT